MRCNLTQMFILDMRLVMRSSVRRTSNLTSVTTPHGTADQAMIASPCIRPVTKLFEGISPESLSFLRLSEETPSDPFWIHPHIHFWNTANSTFHLTFIMSHFEINYDAIYWLIFSCNFLLCEFSWWDYEELKNKSKYIFLSWQINTARRYDR